MGNPLENLKCLRDDMRKKGWVITSFLFSYKAYRYIVLIHLYSNEKQQPKYALVKLEFLREENSNDTLIAPANSRGLLEIAPKDIRRYFHIEYHENFGDIMQQFNENLGRFIPKEVNENPSVSERMAMIKSLSNSDSDDPNKIYSTVY
jgi:hypothetical protein